MKKIVSVFSMLMVFLIAISSVYAAKYIVVDNDPLSSSPGIAYNNGYTYGKGTYDYNGDYRISKPTISPGMYLWGHKSLDYAHAGEVSYRVFLHNSKFTCPKVAYYVSGSDMGEHFACYLNQDTAPGGWSYIIKNYCGSGHYQIGGEIDNRFCSGGGQIGADAFEMIVPN